MTRQQGVGILILWLAPCFCFTALASYQYREVTGLAQVYQLELSPEEEARFVELGKSYQSLIFSDPIAATNLLITHSNRFNNPKVQLVLSYWMAKALAGRSQYSEALALMSSMDLIAMNPSFTGDVTVLKARLQKDLDEVEAALKLFFNAEQIFIAGSDLIGLATTYINYGEAYRSFSQYDKALSYLQEAAGLQLEVQFPSSLQLYLWNRKAAVFNETDRLDSAGFYSQQIISLTRKTNNQALLASSLNELGLIYEKREMLDAAIQCYLEALEIWKANDNPRYWTNVVSHLGRVYLRLGKLAEAERYINEGLPIAESSQWHAILYVYYDLLASIAFEQGRHMQVFELKDKAKAAQRLDFERLMNKELAVQQARLETEKKQIELDLISERITTAEKQKRWAIAFGIATFSAAFILFIFYIWDRKRKKEMSAINEQLESALELNKQLFRDVHHRIKNNLAMLIALVDHQRIRTKNKALATGYDSITNRLEAIAVVHARLEDFSESSEANMVDVLNELKTLAEVNVDVPMKIELRTNEDFCGLSPEKTIVVGIILNELMTNSSKHATRSDTDNFIQINYIDGSWVTIAYQDSGPGIPLPSLDEGSEHTGNSLLSMMIEQLHGEVTLDEQSNTLTVRFCKD